MQMHLYELQLGIMYMSNIITTLVLNETIVLYFVSFGRG